jgi:hypothetical protein
MLWMRTGLIVQSSAVSCTLYGGQDALEAAHQKDRTGKASEAIKTYRIGNQIIDEGLKLEVPSVGLGPAFSNTARWRADLSTWKAQAADRSAVDLV